MPMTAAWLLFLSTLFSQGPAWAIEPFSSSDWPTFKGDNARSGRGQALDLPIGVAWTTKLKGSLYSSPVCLGGLVVLGSSSKRVYGVDLENGAVRWQTQVGEKIWGSSAALFSGRAYIGCVNGCVHILSLADGTQLPPVCPAGADGQADEGDILSPMLVQAGRLVFGSDDDSIYGYELGLEAHWSCPTGGILHDNGAAVDSGLVVMGSHDAKVYAVDLNTGQLRWTFSGERGFNTVPAMDGERAFIGDAAGRMHALAAKDGRETWSFDTGGAIVSSPALSGDGAVVFGSTDGNVYCLDAASGALRWTFKTGDYVLASPLLTGKLVWIGSYDGVFYVLDLATGKERWRKQLPGGIYTSAALAGNRVLVAGRSGELDCLQAVLVP